MAEDASNVQNATTKEDDNFNVKAGIFFTGVAGVSAIIGFGATVGAVKRQDAKYFNKGMAGSLEMVEPAVSVAFRALGWGTLYAFTGCGILFYSIWKLSGARNFEEFRLKVGSVLPRIPKNDPPQGRTEFSGMTDLLDYLANERSSKK